jgi:acylphosphatase
MTETPTEALRAFVRGRVQGVGFRAYVVWRARELNLQGFTRNLSDGTTVEVVAEGPRQSLDALLAYLRQGPPLSRVTSIEERWSQAKGAYQAFNAR